MERATPACVQTRALPAQTQALLAACPTPAALLAWLPAGLEPSLLAANAAALDLLGLSADHVADFIACFEDEHEHAFRRAVQTASESNAPLSLKVLARRRDDAEVVMLEARLAPCPPPADAAPGESWIAVHFSPAAAVLPAGGPPALNAKTIDAAVFAVSRAAQLAPTLSALYESTYRIVRQFVGAENFYIAVVDEAEQMLRFVYAKDQYDPPADRPLGRLGVTDIVYFTGRPLLLDRRKADRMLAEGSVVNHGYPAQVWLGVPLKVSGRTIGVLAVQDYQNPDLLGENERRLLAFISDQIAHAIALRRADTSAQAARAAAERASRAKSDFLAAMSHELRSPLTVVLGYGEILAEHPGDPQVRSQADSIVRSARQLLAAIDQTLDYTIVEAGARLPHPVTFRLDELVRSLEGEFTLRAQDKGLAFATRTEGVLPEGMQADAKLLRQILAHLLGNAVKFTTAGGVTLRVRVEPMALVRPPRQRISFMIEDTGPGIAPGKMDHLFEPVAPGRDPDTRNPFGAGVGLAISRRLAEMLDARLSARSAPGTGSVFTLAITVPLAVPLIAPNAVNQAEELLRARLREQAGGLLVVDTNPDTRAVLAEQLAGLTGRPPATATDAGEALDACRSQPVSVILFDTHLEGTDGPALCSLLRADPAAGDRPFLIAVSSDHSAALVERCLGAGANDFLPKPLTRPALLSALLHALDQLEARRMTGV
jgi:signal transduction histidine kinase/CheY-like chemotaxis protein